jgi:hypothetical protein
MSVRLGVVAAAFTVALAGSAAAQTQEIDPNGGQICRPQGGGASDCTSKGLQPGEYHCVQEPCFTNVNREKDVWCDFGLRYPMRSSNPRGDFPTTAHLGPDRVVATGSVLRIETGTTVQGPQDCRPSAPVFEHVSSAGAPAALPWPQRHSTDIGFLGWIGAVVLLAGSALARRTKVRRPSADRGMDDRRAAARAWQARRPWHPQADRRHDVAGVVGDAAREQTAEGRVEAPRLVRAQ